MEPLRHASLFALFTLFIGLVPLVMAVVYVLRPSTVLGSINVLNPLWRRELAADTFKIMAVGAAESLVPVFVGFASLTVAWLLVAVGMGRRGQ